MLEVNDFNAVRISLASPEQIRSWSYGEVTKPETINYRTLKPEKDGLFCEKIFGPTKDWECYCGKYKRVRYKGIICDKCGVEVTRSKVRRERMGHIELAAPVSHIWFVKGTPSRIGLLLDISPRSLERVLYFAQYIIIDIDEEARARELAEIERQLQSLGIESDQATQERIATINAAVSQREAELRARQAAEESVLTERRDREIAAARAEEQALRTELQAFLNQAAPRDITYGDQMVVRFDQMVNANVLHRLDELAADRIAAIERNYEADLENLRARIGAEIDQLRHTATAEASAVTEQQVSEVAKRREELEAQKADLESLQRLQLLNESRYRELHERWGHVFRAGMGAEAIREIICSLDLNQLAEELRAEIRGSSASGQRRKKATKRLRVVEAFRKSGNKPEWMILTVLPVLPPDLRPMVQLDGGRFATSDLNDLYRRVINRNNRLKRLIELGAPEIIIRNEKRMLQEAVDSLIDNGRRGRAVSGSSNHKLKSLSDMLKGKQGRFRQNLLGKRVDYSGRSVIIVGPNLKLHQVGLPKIMAVELFKPFVMRKLVERGYAHNIKSAKRIVERLRPEVWDVLEEVVADHPVLLNRAPTLHRLGIQAFQPVLIDGKAIRIHPLVCAAFGADFDGDQMAVHVPLSNAARREAVELMLSTRNLLLPSNGEPTVAPTLDMVLGCYYLTVIKPGVKGEGKVFASPDEAILAYNLGVVDLHAAVKLRRTNPETGASELIDTSVGRIIFNEVLPEALRYLPETNDVQDRKRLRTIVGLCYRKFGSEKTAEVVDQIKRVGFDFAMRSGITIAIGDLQIPAVRDELLRQADQRIAEIEKQYRRGLITEEERYNQAIEIWNDTIEQVTKAVGESLDRFGSVYMMTTSGAKGNIQQLRQMAGMRGLMAAPSGRIIDLPIRSSFREGLSVLEYFISTHGARKGLADTAIRTADSGYLTRRLIDVAQDVIVQERDCGTTAGIWLEEKEGPNIVEPLRDRIVGRLAASPIADPVTGEILVDRNEMITEEIADELLARNIRRVHVRSPLSCQATHGVCQFCYGQSPARGHLVDMGEAVGIIAAQSIGEPGTQLTMRTFHTGGIAGVDITSGLPRVEELFEARVPKGQAIISEIDGVVTVNRSEEPRRIKVTSTEVYHDEHPIPEGFEILVEPGDQVDFDQPLARRGDEVITARFSGTVSIEDHRVIVAYEERDEREYVVPPTAQIRVENGQVVKAGDLLTEGAANPQDILRILGREAVELYLVEEVQKVYRSQGVTINDKHIEIIVRQMLRKVRVDSPGDTELLPGELVDRFAYEEINARVLAEGGEPATAQTVLLGVTKASLNTESFLAAASFQETTRVLTQAAIQGSVDRLLGLKENVIIGKLIPAGSGLAKRRSLKERARMVLLGEGEEEGTALPAGDTGAASGTTVDGGASGVDGSGEA
jgi:DNA-directed RNA polymerase subunit beta'